MFLRMLSGAVRLLICDTLAFILVKHSRAAHQGPTCLFLPVLSPTLRYLSASYSSTCRPASCLGRASFAPRRLKHHRLPECSSEPPARWPHCGAYSPSHLSEEALLRRSILPAGWLFGAPTVSCGIRCILAQGSPSLAPRSSTSLCSFWLTLASSFS